MANIQKLRETEKQAKAELEAALQAVKDAEARKKRAFEAWMKANKERLEAELREEIAKTD